MYKTELHVQNRTTCTKQNYKYKTELHEQNRTTCTRQNYM